MFGDGLFSASEIKTLENGEVLNNSDLSSAPTMEKLEGDLQDIFTADTSDYSAFSTPFSETPFEEGNYARSVTLDDGTLVELPYAKTDDNGIVYEENGELRADTTYELNGNSYTTDECGRIIHCEASPKRSPENPRDISGQLEVGGEDRRSSDQGGHIVGRDLNGDGGPGNLVAMDSKINQSDYKRMENDIKDSLDNNKDVSLTADISYSGDSKRPDIITATTTVDGSKTVYKFDNNLDGGLMTEVPANGKEAVNQEIKDTKGTLSSIKEVYDADGKLSETTATVTYTDEQGVNHRTKVYIEAE